MLNKPPHIAAANIADLTTGYPWDEWQVTNAYQPADPELEERMATLTHRANVAMCIAMAEWVVWRFEKLDPDPVPLEYLEAAWAANVHTAYGRYIETIDEQWRGVVRGPLNIALAIVIDLIWGIDEVTPGTNVGWMSKLAELVLTDAAPFVRWRDQCIERLERHYPRPPDDPEDLFEERDVLGPWVPRELFDLTQPFDPAHTPVLIERFIKSLDHEANEFLHSPEEMLEFEDFAGVPYAPNQPA